MTRTHFTSQRLRPASVADATQKQPRTDEFGAVHVRNELTSWLDEGSYFRAVNPTIGTAIATSIQTSWSATNAALVLRNTSLTRRIIPHYVRLICNVAPASATSCQLAIVLDTAVRYSSGGSDLTANIQCADTSQGPASVADLRFGALTCSAASAPRVVGRSAIKTQAAPAVTVGDEILITFGGVDGAAALSSGAATARYVVQTGHVVLGGQNHSMLLHIWNPANAATAPTYEVEAAWWER